MDSNLGRYEKAVKSRRARYGDDIYSRMGEKGGRKSRKVMTSEMGKEMALKRWKKRKMELQGMDEIKDMEEEFKNARQ